MLWAEWSFEMTREGGEVVVGVSMVEAPWLPPLIFVGRMSFERCQDTRQVGRASFRTWFEA